MSDTSQGPGWWLGVDGKWYPPVAAAPAPPTAQTGPVALPPTEPPPGTPGTGGSSEPTGDLLPPPPGASPAAPTKGRNIVALIIGAVVLGFVVVIGTIVAVTLLGKSSTRTVNGTFTLKTASMYGGSSCYGTGGYDDIRNGANVRLSDGDGKMLATTSLTSANHVGSSCVFQFTLEGVPERDFYTLEVSHRGQLSYSKADLRNAGWEINASLGSG